MKMFLAGLVTETNTFSNIPTSRASFENTALARGRDAVLAQPLFSGFLTGLEATCQELGIDTHYGLVGFAQPSGAMVQSEYAVLRDELLDGLRQAMPVDAVLLMLHGAMVAQDTWDCEGDILARVREIIGAAIPVAAMLDPHAHLTEQMVERASIMAFMKEYPHTDGPARLHDMLSAVRRMWDGTLTPTAAMVDCNLLGFWPTQQEPGRSLTDRFYAAERRDGVVSTSFVHGFPWGDTPETGSKVLVYTNNIPALAQQVAQELADAVIAAREGSRIVLTPVDEALDAVSADGLTVLADWADNAGGGAPSDSSFILHRVLDRKMSGIALGLFYDPELVKFCFAAGLGATVEGRIGGKTGRYSGEPIDFTGVVHGLQREATQLILGTTRDRMGDAAWLRIGGADVIVNSVRAQCYDPSAFQALGLDIREHSAVVVKSSNHFHHGFAPLARRIIFVGTPGALSADFAQMPYQRLHKPRWPRSGA